ncbi:MAG TPA: DUF4956 domain-containing protein [Lachnospiraceae bacterium]|nr:DUF4956 domain-containing protein [Lachnospiraceae bacterium]
MTFNDIFKSSFLESVTGFSLSEVLLAMLFAVIVGLLIFWVYKKTFTGILYSSGFALTLIGLTLVTTLVIIAVTSNVVLSLGMVGALSIVRFRTAIKEPMEIVFLFWSIAVGIVIGAGMIPLAVLGSVIIGIILLIFANRKNVENAYILVLNCENEEAENTAAELLKNTVKKYRIKSKTVNVDGIELTTELKIKDDKMAFVNRMNEIAGVKNATLVSYNGVYMS